MVTVPEGTHELVPLLAAEGEVHDHQRGPRAARKRDAARRIGSDTNREPFDLECSLERVAERGIVFDKE
jgi:hypothetical protein